MFIKDGLSESNHEFESSESLDHLSVPQNKSIDPDFSVGSKTPTHMEKRKNTPMMKLSDLNMNPIMIFEKTLN